MTDTIEPVELYEDEKHQIAKRLVDQAREQGVDLVGPRLVHCRPRPLVRTAPTAGQVRTGPSEVPASPVPPLSLPLSEPPQPQSWW